MSAGKNFQQLRLTTSLAGNFFQQHGGGVLGKESSEIHALKRSAGLGPKELSCGPKHSEAARASGAAPTGKGS